MPYHADHLAEGRLILKTQELPVSTDIRSKGLTDAKDQDNDNSSLFSHLRFCKPPWGLGTPVITGT